MSKEHVPVGELKYTNEVLYQRAIKTMLDEIKCNIDHLGLHKPRPIRLIGPEIISSIKEKIKEIDDVKTNE